MCADWVFLDDQIQQRIGILEDLASLRALLLMLEYARVNAFQSPRVEQRRPVDEFAQRRQRNIFQYAYAGKRWDRYVIATPLNRNAPGARLFERDDMELRRRMGLAERFIVGSML